MALAAAYKFNTVSHKLLKRQKDVTFIFIRRQYKMQIGANVKRLVVDMELYYLKVETIRKLQPSWNPFSGCKLNFRKLLLNENKLSTSLRVCYADMLYA
jgi:hypothetical protein